MSSCEVSTSLPLEQSSSIGFRSSQNGERNGTNNPGGSTTSLSTTDNTDDNFARRQDSRLQVVQTLDSRIERTNRLSRRSSAIEKAGLTIHKLRFDTERLYGRDAEIKILLQALEKCCQTTTDPTTGEAIRNNRQLVSIGGESGTGKSALAQCLKGPVVNRARGIFITGKFSPENHPYRGIESACEDLCLALLERPDAIANIRVKLLEEMGDDALLTLTEMLPGLTQIIDLTTRNDNDKEKLKFRESLVLEERSSKLGGGREIGNQAQQHRFRYAFCRFFQCIKSCYQGPLVLVLNDVQWADQASLDLIFSLLDDPENPHSLMIVTTYRSEEIDADHIYSNLLGDLRNIASLTLTGISLGNLGKDQVNEILQTLLSVDDAQDLADLCHKRTHGNALFLKRFMTLLEEEELLQFNYGQLDWKWDCTEIEEKTSVEANVVDLLTVKMTSMESGLQRLLSLASCLGPRFDYNTLSIIWHAMMPTTTTTTTTTKEQQGGAPSNSVEKWLWLAMEEHFLEKEVEGSGSSTYYRWSHDKVQEAASSLLSNQQDAHTLKFQLGEILYRSYNPHQLYESIFLVANLMNSVADTATLTTNQQTRCAELNLKAAIKAKDLSAFESTASYVTEGLKAIGHDHSAEVPFSEQWPQDSFPLLLDLYSVGAQAELALGRSEQAERYCDEILRQENASSLDKMRAHNVMLQSMGAGGRPAEAVTLAFKVLKDLGCKFKNNSALRTVSAISSFVKVLNQRNAPTKEEIQNLPLMTDPAKMECMKIMDMSAAWTHVTGQSFVFLLFLGRMVDWSLKYGLSERSPAAFANVGFLASHVKGNKDLGLLWGDHSMLALERVESKICQSRCFMARSWSSPYSSTLQPLLKGYKMGMMAGDVMNAVLCLWHVIHHALLSGMPLHKIEDDCQTYIRQMTTLKQQQAEETTRITRQAILNLMGFSGKNTTMLKGDALDEEEFLSKGDGAVVLWSMDHFQAIKSYLYCYFDEHDAGAELALKKLDSYQKRNPGGCIGTVDCFARGLSLYDAARKKKEKQRLYRKHAIAARSAMAGLARNGNPNITHLLMLLNAEHAALTKSNKKHEVVKSYESAITLAGRRGFPQDVALGNERLADFLLTSSKMKDGDEEDAHFRLQTAREYYEEWGATQLVKKVQHKIDLLERKMPPKRNTECWR